MTLPIIADHFLKSAEALSVADRGLAMSFLGKFMADPEQPGLRLKRINAAGPKTYSARINRDLRAIIHRDGPSWILCHVGHHDAAYAWAEGHDVERHARTGALQIVETVETIREVERTIIRPVYVDTAEPAAEPVAKAPPAPTFDGIADDYLLALGLPERWLPTLRKVTNDDELTNLYCHLPPDVGDRIWGVSQGKMVTPPEPVAPDAPITPTPDLQRSFYFADDVAELQALLDAPMAKWIAFLHPSQRALVDRAFSGPAKVSGGAGTGKTVVALHRARHLARQGKRVWLTTFINALCDNLARQLDLLCTADEKARITITTVDQQALAHGTTRRIRPAGKSQINQAINRYAYQVPGFDADFLQAEWDGVIDIQGITDWSAYRRADRRGRGQGIGVRQRKALWGAFEAIHRDLWAANTPTFSMLAARAAERIASGEAEHGFDAVIVDEMQDLNPPKLRLVRAIAADTMGDLMLVGDAGQRIYPGGYSLKRLGIETRGRSTILRINYRTTEQIRRMADRLIGEAVDDLDDGTEERKSRSLLSGPPPTLTGHGSPEAEDAAAVELVRRWLDDDGLAPDAVGVFARTRSRIEAVARAINRAGLPVDVIHQQSDDDPRDGVQAGTMHSAKGLEFKRVLVVGCDQSALPSIYPLRQIRDPQDREDFIANERRLLYVAMTRARDALHISWQGEPSPFVAELEHESAAN